MERFRPPKPAMEDKTLQGIRKLDGGSKRRIDLAEEFVADLKSHDPFSYNMIVRESARRSEIQEKISTRPPKFQSTQRDIEARRIVSWEAIKELKDKGENWEPLRDEYLASLSTPPSPPPPTTTQIPSPLKPGEQGEASSDHKKNKKSRFWHFSGSKWGLSATRGTF